MSMTSKLHGKLEGSKHYENKKKVGRRKGIMGILEDGSGL